MRDHKNRDDGGDKIMMKGKNDADNDIDDRDDKDDNANNDANIKQCKIVATKIMILRIMMILIMIMTYDKALIRVIDNQFNVKSLLTSCIPRKLRRIFR
jgi:hypothetical protein